MSRAGRRAGLATVLALLLAVAAALAACGGSTPSVEQSLRPSQEAAGTPHGAIAYSTSKAFARSVYPRASDTWGEIKAREFVHGTFQQYEYHPRLQEFIFEARGERIHSGNVIAVKEGESAERLIIGAHYDSVPGGDGYTDNAVGVALMLELAARLKSQPTPYTLVFVAFGAEERGLYGSRHFVSDMTAEERASTIGMINLDAVAGGDRVYIFSRKGGGTWLRDDVRAAAEELDVRLRPAPARKGTSEGTATSLTDDLPFHWAGIPTTTLTATNWTAGAKDGSTQTSKSGRIWHTTKDTVQFIEKTYPGRVERQLRELSSVLEVVLTSRLERS